MKRSRAVFLLAPLALAACNDPPQFATEAECEQAALEPCLPQTQDDASSGPVYFVTSYYWHAPYRTPSIRYGFTPSPARGGFGVASRVFAASAAA